MKSTVLTALLLGIVTPGNASPEPQVAVLQQNAASYCYVYSSTFLATVTIGPPSTVTVPASQSIGPPPTTVTTSQPSGTALVPVFFTIVPELQDFKRRVSKRDLGGYLNIAQPPNPSTCDGASIFLIGGGQLFAEGQPIFTEPDVDYLPFNSFGAPPSDAITRYLDVADGYLHWRNSAFGLGRAEFCQVASTGQVYIVFSGPQGDRPAGCVPVSLRSFGSKNPLGDMLTAFFPLARPSLLLPSNSFPLGFSEKSALLPRRSKCLYRPRWTWS